MGTVRLLLALAVVFTHAPAPFGLNLTGGALAVQLFYVISGFYMAVVLDQKYAPTPVGRRAFWVNRVLRLAPCYYAVLLATLALSCNAGWNTHSPSIFPPALATWREQAPHMGWPAQAFLGLVNLTVIGQDVTVFTALDPASGHLVFTPHAVSAALIPAWKFIVIPQAWTLSLELMFYALAPWLVRRSTRWLTTAIVASLVIRAATYAAFGHADPWTYRFFPSELGVFIAGILGYRWYSRQGVPKAAADLNKVARTVLITVVFALIIRPKAEELITVAAFAAAVPWLFRATGRLRADRWIGELSYPVYIGHVMLLPCAWQIATTSHPFSAGLLAAGLAVGFAALFHTLVETSVDRFRQRLAGSPAIPAPTTRSE